jgi:hypothetical protein
LLRLRGDLQALMTAALAAGDEAMKGPGDRYVISGERNLLEVEEFSSNMKRLRELFDLFEQRTSLMQLLDLSHRADGVQIFIGGESGLAPLDECSVVTAPYEVDGQIVGSVGVIGPPAWPTSASSRSSISPPNCFLRRSPTRPTADATLSSRAGLPPWFAGPDRGPADQPGDADGADRAGGARYLGIPFRPARRRDSAPALVADSEWHHSQHPTATVGRKVRVGVDCRLARR